MSVGTAAILVTLLLWPRDVMVCHVSTPSVRYVNTVGYNTVQHNTIQYKTLICVFFILLWLLPFSFCLSIFVLYHFYLVFFTYLYFNLSAFLMFHFSYICLHFYLCFAFYIPFQLTLTSLTWKIWWAPNNASRWQMGFNSAFKGLNQTDICFILSSSLSHILHMNEFPVS